MSNPDLADDIRVLEQALAAGPVPGPWTWWTSCSFRRLSSDATGKDGDVLHGTWQRSDGHPDIVATQPTMDFIAAASPDRIQRVLGELQHMHELLREARDALQGYAGRLVGVDGQPVKNSAMVMVARIDAQMGGGAWGQELHHLRDQAARYHWLCAHLTQIHVETTQPAGSPEDAPMRVTLMQVWPGLPRTDAGSVDAAVGEAMKEGA